jgi:hypothetical protein
MITLTLTAAITQYNQNRDYDGDTAKAKLALQALRVIRMERAQGQGHAGVSLSFQAIEDEIKELESFIAVSDTTRKRASFTAARSRWS